MQRHYSFLHQEAEAVVLISSQWRCCRIVGGLIKGLIKTGSLNHPIWRGTQGEVSRFRGEGRDSNVDINGGLSQHAGTLVFA